MKTIASYSLISLVLLMAVSCTNSEFKKTKSGLQYKIFTDGKGEPAKKGQFIKVEVVQKIRDSVLSTTVGGMPLYVPVDSARPVYNPTEIFSLLRKGDSAVVVEEIDTLQRRMGGQPLPPFIKKKDKFVVTFRVLDIFASEDLVTSDKNAEMAKEKDREIKAVEGYLAKNNITAQKTEKGAYVVIQSVGDGAQVDSGKQVSVRYTGKLFPSGTVFQSNMTGPGNEPLKIVVGTGAVIPGLDDGLRKFKKGGKGTLYLPAYLAYDQQAGPGHKPYENLIFDIEVDDVTDAPPPSAQMPSAQPPQRSMPSQQKHK
jgi:FKBP-type peptidyl-prolyl cis-trans isomerase